MAGGCSGGFVGGFRYIIKPLHGPTCKIARFKAELKFQNWNECGNYTKMTFNFFKQKLQMAALLV